MKLKSNEKYIVKALLYMLVYSMLFAASMQGYAASAQIIMVVVTIILCCETTIALVQSFRGRRP